MDENVIGGSIIRRFVVEERHDVCGFDDWMDGWID